LLFLIEITLKGIMEYCVFEKRSIYLFS
jgi:hypothetical protein